MFKKPGVRDRAFSCEREWVATRGLLNSLRALGGGQFLLGFTHRFALECDLVGVMHEPVEDGIGEGGIADGVMPLGHRQLAGDHGSPGVVAIVQQLEQVAPRAFGERGDPQQLPANYLYGALTCGVVGVPARPSSDGERYFARTAIGG